MTANTRSPDRRVLVLIALGIAVLLIYGWLAFAPGGWLNPHRAAVAPRPTGTFPPTWTPTVTSTPVPTRPPTDTPTPLPTSTATPTPDPRWPLFVWGLRADPPPPATLTPGPTVTGTYTGVVTYLITYTTEGLTRTAQAWMPEGAGRFPIVLMCHDLISAHLPYTHGLEQEALALAHHGYLTIVPDLRVEGRDPFLTRSVRRVIALLRSLWTLQKEDTEHIALWGEGMGGAVALKTAVVRREIDALVLIDPWSADEAENARAFPEIVLPTEEDAYTFGSPEEDRLAYLQLSPLYSLEHAPPMIVHHSEIHPTTPITWSERLVEKAQESGVEAVLWRYAAEVDATTVLSRSLPFLDGYLLPQPTATP